jgi:hypothetical protein
MFLKDMFHYLLLIPIKDKPDRRVMFKNPAEPPPVLVKEDPLSKLLD